MKQVTSQCDILSQARLRCTRVGCAPLRGSGSWWHIRYSVAKMSRARWRGLGAARHRSRPLCIPCSTSTSVPVASVPQDIAWCYYCLANVSVTCRGYLVTRCLLLDAGGGVYQHTTIVEVPNPFQPIKSCYNIDPPFYKGVPQPETLDLDLHFYKL
jgi:hypothetical protein